MPLSSGTRLGPHEILAPIGAGGMGEVYKARDTRLGREVAVKVSAEQFTERFEREARAIAALNHPNICQLYDVGPNYLVMELIEGPTLADRIKSDGAIPLDESLVIAKQIAAALEEAHEKNIIHRDLKPGNIKIRPDGMVKVLDFGLAKLTGPAAQESAVDPELSPTLSLAATQHGVILGTAGYMSPEQARGKAVDTRTDIWAFGVVLYEMLTGKRLFTGEDTSEVLAKVIRDEPDWNVIPAHVRRLLQSCLEKDPRKRLRHIGDVWRLIPDEESVKALRESQTKSTETVSGARFYAGWIVAAVVALASGALAFVHFRERLPRPPDPVVFEVVSPKNTRINGLSVSPDGRNIAFTAAGADGTTQLWVRSFGSPEARPLGVRAVAASVFWSPDSRFIGFASGGTNRKLQKIPATGGPPETICDLNGGAGLRGAAWSTADVIIYSEVGNFGTAVPQINRVSANGGTPSPVTVMDRNVGQAFQINPIFLPDGRHFLYYQGGPISGIFVGSIDAKPGQQNSQRLLAADSSAVYAPPFENSGVGHILFERAGTLVAQEFDTDHMTLRGEARAVASDVAVGNRGTYSVSFTGVLAYQAGRGQAVGDTHLLWLDRQGKPGGEVGTPSNYAQVQLSFDGKRIAATKNAQEAGGATRTWIADVARGIFSRLTADGANENSAAISIDGSVAVSSTRNGAAGDIYVSQSNGLGMPELWVKSQDTPPLVLHPNQFSPDGRFLIYDVHHPQRQQDLWIVPTTGEHKPIPFLTTPADETFGQFSPDSKWVAYSSDESGRREVYVQGFAPDHSPATAVGKWQVSSAGGDKPRWRHDGKELFYLALDGKLMAVPVKSGTTFEPNLAVPLFEIRAIGFFPYDVAPDGRFLVNTPVESDGAATPITVILNWQAALK